MSEDKREEDFTALVTTARPAIVAIADSDESEVINAVVDPTIPTNAKFPPELKATASASRQQFYAERFSSPLPPPDVLESYSRVPGALEQILRVLEKQQDHSHAMDREEMSITKQESLGAIQDAQAGRQQARIGQWASVIICLASFLASVIICIYGASEYAFFAGGAIGIGALATIVATLVTGRPPNEGNKALPKAAEKAYTERPTPPLPEGKSEGPAPLSEGKSES
jgi:uncharacterized membrane protein